MDPVKKDDRIQPPVGLSVTPRREGEPMAVEPVAQMPVEQAPSVPELATEFSPAQFSSNPNPQIDPSVRKHLQVIPDVVIPPEIATQQKVGDMGTTTVVINAEALFRAGNVVDAKVDEAGVIVRQEDRTEELREAA